MRSPHRPTRSRTATRVVAAAALALALGACGGTSSAGTTTSATPTTTAAPTTSGGAATTTAPTATTTTTVVAGGCTAGSTTIPAGATTGRVIDVDGDGRPDEAWILAEPSGTVEVGVVTAAGGGAQRVWNSGSPVRRSFLVVHINDDTPPLFLADDGRTVQLWAFDNCAIADVLNVQGRPYTFSLGFGEIGTGVGCATIDGTFELVGLDVTGESESAVDWSSTVVTVRGIEARNGEITTGTFTSPADDTAISLLHGVACGSETIDADGISARQ